MQRNPCGPPNGVHALRWLLFPLALMLGGCNGEPTRDELQDRVDDLEAENAALSATLDDAKSKVSNAGEAAERAHAAAGEAQAQTERFRSEDWKSVVGDVQDAADEADTRADEAEDAAEDAANALED